ncbi:hypothetical protein RI367_002189 [Sorochytrium milnesiophthora]
MKRPGEGKSEGEHADKKVKRNSVKYRLDNQQQSAPPKVNGPGAPPTTRVVRNVASTPRKHTVSIAVPGSFIDNLPSLELKTYAAGQIARALSVFNVDEVVVYNDSNKPLSSDPMQDASVLLGKVLQYLECPQYLRKFFFPHQPALKFVGLLGPLDTPHHVRIDEFIPFREGVVTDKKGKKEGDGSVVNVGMRKDVVIDRTLTPGVRVTVALTEAAANARVPKGKVVSPKAPREEAGIYWGYQVRIAESLSAVFDACPFKDGYDLKIGTSTQGADLAVEASSLPAFSHMLVVFGGPAGIEAAVEADQSITVAAEDARTLFDRWVNSCPNPGSRTMRTEENVLVTMSLLRPAAKGKE